MTTRRLEGRPVADAVLDEARATVERARGERGRGPVLASVHRGGDSPFQVYLRQQIRTGERAGVTVRPEPLPPGADAAALRRTLEALDADPATDAVLVEHPLPPALEFERAVAALRPWKDVDGVGATNLGRLVAGTPIQVPAVAQAALAIVDHYAVPVSGQRVAVIGRSPTVGLPLALLLLARGRDATVTVAHSRSADLAAALAGHTVLFSCAGHPGLLGRRTVPEGATVIDVGLSRVADPAAPGGGRMAGDAAADLDGWAGALTPVPGGVGPVTVAVIIRNAVRAWVEAGRGDRA